MHLVTIFVFSTITDREIKVSLLWKMKQALCQGLASLKNGDWEYLRTKDREPHKGLYSASQETLLN